jgi:hypothetical protein
MALPRQARPRRSPLSWGVLPAILLAAAVSAAAGGAVVSLDGDEPLPASRPPISRIGAPPSRPGGATPAGSPRTPCPYPHKCADAPRPARRQVALERTNPPSPS